jgi:hypothetical protein
MRGSAGWPQGQGRQVAARKVVSDNRWELEVDKGINRELSMRRRSFASSDSKLRDFCDFNFRRLEPRCDASRKLRFRVLRRSRIGTQHRLSTLRMARSGLIALAACRSRYVEPHNQLQLGNLD